MPTADPAATEEPVFEALLTPHRSLGPRGFVLVMALIGSISFTAGLVFFLAGAWPVVGFMGLDVLLVWLAFRLNYRSARQYERLHLTRESLQVERVTHYGERRSWAFEPAWLRVEMRDPPEPDSPLTLASGRRRLAIGSFLTAEERLELAEALRAALAKTRQAPHLA